ncbi:hypothetical protein RsoM2USA_159 [Ralstonia phage RsoM2USA]|nr:hypothetical protein RsoM2USA_159 [Ralstonia phage RsoM2USA]
MELNAQTHESKFRIDESELKKLIKEHVATELNVPEYQVSVSFDIDSGIDPYADDQRYGGGYGHRSPRIRYVNITVNHLAKEPVTKEAITTGMTKTSGTY